MINTWIILNLIPLWSLNELFFDLRLDLYQQGNYEYEPCDFFNPLYSGNSLTSAFANSEDPDEMQLNAAFQQGLHCL